MADDVVNFDGLSISFDDKSPCNVALNGQNGETRRFYVGQLISLQINLPLSVTGQKKLKTTHPEKSPIAQNLFTTFMRQLLTSVGVKYSFKPFTENSSKNQMKEASQWLDCILISSYHEAICCPEDMKRQPFLSKDKSSYHIPLQVRIPDIPSQFSTVQLEVQARSVSSHVPRWLSSPTRNEPDHFYEPHETSIGATSGKRVNLPLRIIHPPQLKFQQKSVAGKHMIFLQIKNSSAYYCMKVDECVILPESCPKSNKNVTCTDCKSQQFPKGKIGCSQHANMVKMVSGIREMFDNLSPSECYTLCYTLNTADGLEQLSKEDLSLEVHIKWSIPYQQYGEHTSVLTTYRLPSMKVKQAPFVMCASLEETTVKKGDSFTVCYSITNRLQDFLAITLNWNPIQSDKDNKDLRWRRFQDGLVCQDPCIELGPCSYGSTLQAKVRFQAVTPGVYEVCKHMKINLRYLIPSSETVSLGSPCSQTSDDLLCVAAEELWRSRSGSGSSFNEAQFLALPEIENRCMMGLKSYSSGELGPELSSGEFDTGLKYRNRFEEKPSLQKLEVPHSNKYEQLLLSPNNFLKSGCQIYVR